MQIILTVLLSLLAAVFYRMGGSGKYNTKIRDMGIPTIVVIIMCIWGFWHWSLIICWFLLFGALTTYWDFVNKWIGVDDGEHWWNWFLTGFGYALAMLPIVIAWGLWDGFFLRLAILPIAIMVWSVIIGIDWLEEGGRGFLIIATLPLLWIS